MAAQATFQGAIAAPTVTTQQAVTPNNTFSQLADTLTGATKLATAVIDQDTEAQVAANKAAQERNDMLDTIQAQVDADAHKNLTSSYKASDALKSANQSMTEGINAFAGGNKSQAYTKKYLTELSKQRDDNQAAYNVEISDGIGATTTAYFAAEPQPNPTAWINKAFTGKRSKTDLANDVILGVQKNIESRFSGITNMEDYKVAVEDTNNILKEYNDPQLLGSRSKKVQPTAEAAMKSIETIKKTTKAAILTASKDAIKGAENKDASNPLEKYNTPPYALEEHFNNLPNGDQLARNYQEKYLEVFDAKESVELFDTTTDTIEAGETTIAKDAIKAKISDDLKSNVAFGQWSEVSKIITTQGSNASEYIAQIKAEASSADPEIAVASHQVIYSIISDDENGNTAFNAMFESPKERGDFLALDYVAEHFTQMDLHAARQFVTDKYNSEYAMDKSDNRVLSNLIEGKTPDKVTEIKSIYSLLRQRNIDSSTAKDIIKGRIDPVEDVGPIEIEGMKFDPQAQSKDAKNAIGTFIKNSEQNVIGSEFTYSYSNNEGTVIQYNEFGAITNNFDNETTYQAAGNMANIKQYDKEHPISGMIDTAGETFVDVVVQPDRYGATTTVDTKPKTVKRTDIPDSPIRNFWNWFSSTHTLLGKDYEVEIPEAKALMDTHIATTGTIESPKDYEKEAETYLKGVKQLSTLVPEKTPTDTMKMYNSIYAPTPPNLPETSTDNIAFNARNNRERKGKATLRQMLMGDAEVDVPKIEQHLLKREGSVNKSYKDSVGKLTGGIGHLLTPQEIKKYPLGTDIPKEVTDAWFKEDSAEAIDAAKVQAKELGVDKPELIQALTSVNFQLGTNWNKIHKKTWKLLQSGNFKEAAKEAANSKWNKQTPVRVKDFQDTLLKLDNK